MSKQVENKTLGFTVQIEVPSSIEEYGRLAGNEGAALNDAIWFTIFHGWNGEFRTAFAEALEKETGNKRKLNEEAMAKAQPKKDGTKTPIYEQEGKYVDRVLAELGKEVSDFQDLATRVAATVKFDPSEGARTGGRIGKEYLDAANSVFAKESADPEVVKRTVGNLERLNPGLKVEVGDDGRPTPEALARAIKVNADRKLREATAEITQ